MIAKRTAVVKSFFLRDNEHGPADQLPLHGAVTALPLSLELRSILVSHWPTLSHRYSSVSEGRRGSLFHKFGLKPRVIPGDNQPVGIGCKAKVLGKVEMPSGMGGVNGIVKKTVIDSPGFPPLTLVSLLKQVGPVIDLNSNTMDFKKIETTTTLRALPSGHVAHKLTEFAPAGWKAPTPEQTELFQVRADVFRPVTLPGEFKPRSSKHCAGFSSGFVCTVRDRSHLSPSHHQHDPDLCVGDNVSSDLFSDDQLAQGTSDFECSFASGFDVDLSDGKVVRWSQRFGGEDLLCGAWFTSPERCGRSCWSLGNKLPQESLRQSALICPNPWSIAPTSGARWMCATRSCTECSQRGKGQDERKEEGGYHDQPKSHTDRTKESEDVACPRFDRELQVFNTASEPILRCRGWSLAGTPCTLIKACHNGAVVHGGLRSTNRTGGGSSTSGSGGPKNTLQDETVAHRIQLLQKTGRPRCKLWRQILWQHLRQQYQHLPLQQQLVAPSTTDPWRVLPEDGGSTGDRWSMDTRTDRIGVQPPNHPTQRQS